MHEEYDKLHYLEKRKYVLDDDVLLELLKIQSELFLEAHDIQNQTFNEISSYSNKKELLNLHKAEYNLRK